MKYVILIPAYNPDDKIIELLKIINKEYDTVVVDDGSSDKSIFDQVKDYAHVISYEENMGKGFALKTGITYINETYKNYCIVSVDADMQHDYNDAINLCKECEKYPDSLILGRRHWDNTTPKMNRFGNWVMRRMFKRYTGLSIYDTQSGLRCFSYKLTPYMLEVEGNRYEYEMNMLYNLKTKDIKFREVDIKTIYIDKNETSKFNTIEDSLRIIKNIKKWKKNN